MFSIWSFLAFPNPISSQYFIVFIESFVLEKYMCVDKFNVIL